MCCESCPFLKIINKINLLIKRINKGDNEVINLGNFSLILFLIIAKKDLLTYSGSWEKY